MRAFDEIVAAEHLASGPRSFDFRTWWTVREFLLREDFLLYCDSAQYAISGLVIGTVGGCTAVVLGVFLDWYQSPLVVIAILLPMCMNAYLAVVVLACAAQIHDRQDKHLEMLRRLQLSLCLQPPAADSSKFEAEFADFVRRVAPILRDYDQPCAKVFGFAITRNVLTVQPLLPSHDRLSVGAARVSGIVARQRCQLPPLLRPCARFDVLSSELFISRLPFSLSPQSLFAGWLRLANSLCVFKLILFQENHFVCHMNYLIFLLFPFVLL